MPLKPGRVKFFLVSNGAVLDRQHEDDAGLLPNFANDAIVPNAVTPEATVFMAQSLTEAARVFVRSNATVHVVEKFPLHCAIYALKVFSTRGSYSTVQAKVLAQLAGSEGRLRVGQTV
jgi:hypothetical protein